MQQPHTTSSVNTGPSSPSEAATPTSVQWLVVPPEQPSQSPIYTYRKRSSVLLSAILMFCGISTMVFSIVYMAISNRYHEYFIYALKDSFWCGILSLTAGILGVVAGSKRTTCMVRVSMVLCILAASYSCPLVIVSVNRAYHLRSSVLPNEYCCYGSDCNKDPDYGDDTTCRKVITLIVMESLLAFVSLIGGFCAIFLSSTACRAACCCRPANYRALPIANELNKTSMSQQQRTQLGENSLQYHAANGLSAEYQTSHPA